MGGVFRREYIWWNIRADWKPARNIRGLLRTQAVGLPSRPQTLARQPFIKDKYINEIQLRGVERGGFSQSSSFDRLTDEQREDLIAENIFDWWQSGKSYKKWYADKFIQLKFDFGEDE